MIRGYVMIWDDRRWDMILIWNIMGHRGGEDHCGVWYVQ